MREFNSQRIYYNQDGVGEQRIVCLIYLLWNLISLVFLQSSVSLKSRLSYSLFIYRRTKAACDTRSV